MASAMKLGAGAARPMKGAPVLFPICQMTDKRGGKRQEA
jgi:hypothetical protein